MRNILLKIAYDGSGFYGWQRQRAARTVCGELEETLQGLFGFSVKLDGTSRTDAGVHAFSQCASLKLPDGGIPTQRLSKAINDRLAKDRLEGVGEIRIISAEEKPEDFHARYSAKGKRYIYKIFVSPEKSPFRRLYFYQLSKLPDICAMKTAAGYIIGTHDFKCFETAGGTPRLSTVRTVTRLDIEEKKEADGVYITITIEGDGFLYNMVRIITGTLVEVGLGKRTPESVGEAIESLDRSRAGHTAPPQGLYLAEVFYDD